MVLNIFVVGQCWDTPTWAWRRPSPGINQHLYLNVVRFLQGWLGSLRGHGFTSKRSTTVPSVLFPAQIKVDGRC